MPLVEYDSSSSSDDQVSKKVKAKVVTVQSNSKTKAYHEDEIIKRPEKRQKKLPFLPDTFDTAPKDDPSLHQGRKRTRPYVDGEYNAHVYLSLNIPSALRTVIEEILSSFQDEIPEKYIIHSLLSNLHISLTHPLPLRRHQIVPFRDQLADQLRRSCSRFKLSFASEIKVYYNRSSHSGKGNDTNGERSGGRAFVALRVGAGAKELKDILDKIIHPLLEITHLPTYHENPEFHTSFGWTLLDPNQEVLSAIGNKDDDSQQDSTEVQDTTSDSGGESSSEKSLQGGFLITPFPDELLKRINNKFQARILEAQPKGGWEIESVQFKVAKEVHTLKLGK